MSNYILTHYCNGFNNWMSHVPQFFELMPFTKLYFSCFTVLWQMTSWVRKPLLLGTDLVLIICFLSFVTGRKFDLRVYVLVTSVSISWSGCNFHMNVVQRNLATHAKLLCLLLCLIIWWNLKPTCKRYQPNSSQTQSLLGYVQVWLTQWAEACPEQEQTMV